MAGKNRELEEDEDMMKMTTLPFHCSRFLLSFHPHVRDLELIIKFNQVIRIPPLTLDKLI